MTETANAAAPEVRAEDASQSVSIGKLAAALAKAQAQFKPAAKSSTNPHFGSKYADLASVLAAIREPLAAHGLAVIQTPLPTDGRTVRLRTVLAHESGEWISSMLVMLPGHMETRRDPHGNKTSEFVHDCSPQALGSCLTYARRYALSAIVGVCADEDDDGNAASRDKEPENAAGDAPSVPPAKPPQPKPGTKAPADFTKLDTLMVERQLSPAEKWPIWLGHFKVSKREQLTQKQVDDIVARIMKEQ